MNDIVYRPVLLTEFTEDELSDLERLILKMKATELSEANRLDVLVGGGYSDRNFSGSLGEKAWEARQAYALLDRLYKALSSRGRP